MIAICSCIIEHMLQIFDLTAITDLALSPHTNYCFSAVLLFAMDQVVITYLSWFCLREIGLFEASFLGLKVRSVNSFG